MARPIVFLSYSHHDLDWVEVLQHNLQAFLGVGSVFLDRRRVRSDAPWISAVQAGIAHAEHLVVVATPDAIASEFVEREWQAFFASKRGRVHVAMLIDTPLPIFLDYGRPCDFTAGTEDGYGAALRALVGEIDGAALANTESIVLQTPPTLPPTLDPLLRRRLVRAFAALITRKSDQRMICSELGIPFDAFQLMQPHYVAASNVLARVTDGAKSPEEGAKKLIDFAEKELDDHPAFRALADLRSELERETRSPSRGGSLHTYRGWLVKRHSKLVALLEGASERLLEDACVELDVEPTLHASPEERERLSATIARQTTLANLLLDPDDTARVGAPRWVIVGEPGAGKTTLARNLTRVLASGDGPLAIFVSLASIEASNFDPIEVAVEESTTPADVKARAALKRALRERAEQRGQLIVLLDGLDEVAPHRITAVRNTIASLAAGAYKHASLAVFARPVALERREFDHPFRHARVTQLDDDRRAQLIDRLLPPGDAIVLKQRLSEQPGLADLGRNPFLLTLICDVAHDELKATRALPRNRRQLFERAIELLLLRGYGIAPVPAKVADVAAARDLLRAMSLRLHKAGGETWKKADLSRLLRTMRGADANLELAVTQGWKGNNDAFLEDISLNSGVLGPHDGIRDQWRYLHRSLREFLAAEAIHSMGSANRTTLLFQIKSELQNFQLESVAQKELPNPERWAEVWGQLCSLEPDPRLTFSELKSISHSVALRWLPAIDAFSPRDGLAELTSIDSWDLAALRAALRAWQVSASDAEASFLEMIGPEWSTTKLAYVWFAIDELGRKPNAQQFFRKCRPNAYPPGDLEWVDIPAGDLRLGQFHSSKNAFTQGNAHFVRIGSFQLMRTAVTRAQYRQFDSAHVSTATVVDKRAEGRLPATEVDWWSAMLFAEWLGARLPTKEEWEHACRAGTLTKYSSGDKESDLERIGWYEKNSGGRPHAVAEKPANQWGLHDMHGNVWEWCTADWRADYDGRRSGHERAVRGGSFRGVKEYAESDLCGSCPTLSRRDTIGFRLARCIAAD